MKWLRGCANPPTPLTGCQNSRRETKAVAASRWSPPLPLVQKLRCANGPALFAPSSVFQPSTPFRKVLIWEGSPRENSPYPFLTTNSQDSLGDITTVKWSLCLHCKHAHNQLVFTCVDWEWTEACLTFWKNSIVCKRDDLTSIKIMLWSVPLFLPIFLHIPDMFALQGERKEIYGIILFSRYLKPTLAPCSLYTLMKTSGTICQSYLSFRCLIMIPKHIISDNLHANHIALRNVQEGRW